MRLPRRPGAVLGALSVVILSSCVGSEVTSPDVDVDPSFAISDGSTDGSNDFYFLPPLVSGNPNPAGDFNPYLSPEMQVCAISEADLGPSETKSCSGRTIVVAPGAIAVTVDAVNDMYAASWDTDGPETDGSAFTTDEFLLLEILVAGEAVGWIDLDPQDPNGPGQSVADAYAFRLGETIPVKFWLSADYQCDPSAFVTECITGAVVGQEGADLSLEGEGNKLGVIIFAQSLPVEQITITLERIDPTLYFGATGQECIPGLGGTGAFDAPQLGDCFRLRTTPEDLDPLLIPALVSICIDPAQIPGAGLTPSQQDQLTMIRYNADDPQNPIWQALRDAAGDCPTNTASLLDVPDRGFMRYAAQGINALARAIGPEPVAAGDLRFGGLTSSFSNFRYALPGEMVATAGDGTVIQASDDGDVEATVNVVDHEGDPVEGAVVHFETTDGSLSASEGTSDASGNVTVTWAVDRATAGDKTLTASALGLLSGPVPSHDDDPDEDGVLYDFTAASIEITASVVGPPASLTQNPTGNIDDAVAGEPQTISVTVYDEFGNPVVGAEVGWACSDSCDIPATSTTDGDGVASAQWTPYTSGSQASVASINGAAATTCDPANDACATFTATVAPATPANLNPTQSATSGYVGSSIDLAIQLTDQYDNAIPGETVSWSIASGGGSFGSQDGTTATDGSATASWTLGSMPGANSATVAAGGLSHTFGATAECFDGWGTATTDGTFTTGEWTCSVSREFTANISGGKTQAFVHWMNDAENLYVAVRIPQSASSKVNDVRFDFENDGDLIAAVGDDAIGLTGGVFIDQFLSQKCFDRSQAGCGEPDVDVDGSGRVVNDGTWTTFELSHPLSGDDQDFDRTAGERVGFFLSLQQGNGAQGNTQWPGFRTYEPIDIVGLPGPGSE